MAITQAMATSFKVEALDGLHAFGVSVIRAATTADVFKIALYTSAATLSAATTAYTATGEVATGGNYAAGGNTLTILQVPTSTGTTAWIDFADSVWAAATITARGAMIYNSTQGNKCVAILDFGADKTSTAGDFTVVFPLPAAATAILSIA